MDDFAATCSICSIVDFEGVEFGGAWYCERCVRCIFIGDDLASDTFDVADVELLKDELEESVALGVISFSPNANEYTICPFAKQQLALVMHRSIGDEIWFNYEFHNLSMRDGPTLRISATCAFEMSDIICVSNERIFLVNAEDSKVEQVEIEGPRPLLQLYAAFNGHMPFADEGYGRGHYPAIPDDFTICPKAIEIAEMIDAGTSIHWFAFSANGTNVTGKIAILPRA
jgi:hypothetical protein